MKLSISLLLKRFIYFFCIIYFKHFYILDKTGHINRNVSQNLNSLPKPDKTGHINRNVLQNLNSLPKPDHQTPNRPTHRSINLVQNHKTSAVMRNLQYKSNHTS